MYLNCFIERKSGLMTIKRRVKKRNKVIVSEHAMLRYIERVLGIDLKEIENRILTDEIKEQYKIIGSGRFSINDEFRTLIRVILLLR